jgi:altronate dehydratase small subunit
MENSERASRAPARDAMMLSEGDNVAVALRGLRAGETIHIDGRALRIERDIAVGHKLAVIPISRGEVILKYGCPIGSATRAISPGEYVHTHNVESNYLPTYTLPT